MRYRDAANPARRRGRTNARVSALRRDDVAHDLHPMTAAHADAALYWTDRCPGCGRLMEMARARAGRKCWRCEAVEAEVDGR